MARISMRAYNKEIENLIDRGQIEEAIAHCKNVIKQFPKHIETYRLLGKAYLESQRYAEAADILQRVLSVFPDDFVSQLGMSIIREDEGNLDASIWHMERAYEVQPFNRAVQDELRRLYGRRDGVEPPRIRLTRGALVRMYARGDLYPQAIAEIRAALSEDQKRVDLLALLARMYFLSGQKVEATEISSSLISKLPYCYEANRILKEVLPETSRAEDARIFQQRLFALDPYAAFISPNAPTSSQVPEQTVMVEKVEWQPDMDTGQSPDWARTIGVRWEDTPEETLPDWLNTIVPGEAVQEPAAGAESAALAEPESPAGDELIPDFLKDAGWQPSDGTQEGALTGFADQAEAPTEEELAEAEIPDWLKTLAPETSQATADTDAEDTASLNWLEGILPAETAQLGDIAPEPGELPAEDLPAGIATELPGFETTETEQPTAELEQPASPDAVPDWLVTLAPDQTEAGVDQEAVAAESPDWLQAFASEQPAAEVEQESVGQGVVPDWLQTLAPGQPEVEAGQETTADETPDWLETLTPVLPEADAEPETSAEETPEWLQTLTPVQPEAEVEPVVGAEETEIPEWLETARPAEMTETADAGAEISAASELPADEQTPDWIVQAQAEQPADVQDQTQPAQDIPDWLKELSSEETPTEEATQPVNNAGVTRILPDEAQPEAESDLTAETPSLEAETPTAAGDNLAEMDLDAAMAWMEALAAKQGADEESLKITPLESRTEVAPDWIQQQAESAAETEEEATAGEVSAVTEAPAAEPVEMPEAFAPTEFEPQAHIETEPVAQDQMAAEPDLNDLDSAMAWMEALAAKQGADEESLKITPPEMRSEVAPDWIQQQAQEGLQQPEAETAPLEPITDEWTAEPEPMETAGPVSEESPLQVLAEETPELAPETLGEVPQVDEFAPEEPEATPDWITELIEEKIPDEEEAVAASLPTDMETTPEPAAEMPEAAVALAMEETIPMAEAETEPETSAEAEIPEWLRSYEEEQRQERAWLPDETLATEAISDDQLPDWLRAETETSVMEQTGATTQILAGAEETAGATPDADVPGWLQDLSGVTGEPEAIPAEQPAESTWVPEYQPETPAASEPALQGDLLALARASLRTGDLDRAAVAYNDCINANQNLGDVIEDLKSALDQHPVDVTLWQTLGDAYMRTDRIQDALDAYTKAEELLR